MTFIVLIILCLISTSILAKWNYNCVNITALVFPVPKTPPPLRQNIIFVEPNEAELEKKIAEVEQKLLPTKPNTKKEAYEQLEQMKIKHNVGKAVNTLVSTPDQEFEDKMKLLQINDFIYYPDMIGPFPFMAAPFPKAWLSDNYMARMFLEIEINKEVMDVDKHFYPRSQAYDDHCSMLALSLQDDEDWSKGSAKDAYNLVIRCYDIFPFDLKASDLLYDMVNFLSNFYVFANFTTSGAGVPMFIQSLKKQRIPFQSNFRFHSYVKSVSNKANDAHCSYKVDCYEQFTFVQPLFLQALPKYPSYTVVITQVSQLILEEWIDAEVVFIDGNLASHVLGAYGTSIGLAHSNDSKMGKILSRRYWNYRLGDFTFDRGLYLLRYTVPNRPYLVFGLRKPQTTYIYEIKVDWLIFKGGALKNFEDQYAYWNLHCAAKPFVKKSIAVKKRSLKTKPRLTKRTLPSTSVIVNRYTYEATRIIVIGPEFAFLIATDPVLGDYAILVVNSFDVSDITGWYIGMQQGFQYLIDNGYKTLILELSGNSGGIICLAYALLAVLSPSTELPFPATKQPYPTVTSPTEMLRKFSTCADEAKVHQSPLQIQSFLNENGLPYPPSASWNDNRTSYTKVISGFTQGSSSFSPFLLDGCNGKEISLLKGVKPKFNKLIVSTDAFCGSSCAIVAANLQEMGNTVIVSTPMAVDRSFPPNAYAFAGGQVISLENIKDIAKRSSCYTDVPQILEAFNITMTYRCIFSLTYPNIPLEFLIFPANEIIWFNRLLLMSMKERWSNILSLELDIELHPEKHNFSTSHVSLMANLK